MSPNDETAGTDFHEALRTAVRIGDEAIARARDFGRSATQIPKLKLQWEDKSESFFKSGGVPVVPHNAEMTSITREEMTAHLDAQLARTDALLARQSADTDRHLSRFEARLDQSLQQMRDDRQDQKEDARSARNTNIGLAAASTLSILLALFGAVYAINSMNSSIIGNVIPAFEAGKTSGASAQATAAAPGTPPPSTTSSAPNK